MLERRFDDTTLRGSDMHKGCLFWGFYLVGVWNEIGLKGDGSNNASHSIFSSSSFVRRTVHAATLAHKTRPQDA